MGGVHPLPKDPYLHGSINSFALTERTDPCLTRRMPSSRSSGQPPDKVVMRQFSTQVLFQLGVPCKIERERDTGSIQDGVLGTSPTSLLPCHDGYSLVWHPSENISDMPHAYVREIKAALWSSALADSDTVVSLISLKMTGISSSVPSVGTDLPRIFSGKLPCQTLGATVSMEIAGL